MSLKGKLLIAEPRLPDPNFFRSVVLVIEHNKEGASGLILNRPTGVQLSDIWSKVSPSSLGRDETIFVGGPVDGPLAVLQDQCQYSEQRLLDGLHLSMKRQNLTPLLGDKTAQVRVFSGYSGWGPGQLENEMGVGGWLTWPAQSEHVFIDSESVYKTVCNDLGLEIVFGDAKPRHCSADPGLN